MRRRFAVLLLALFATLPAMGSDTEDATAAARRVFDALGSQDYEKLYDSLCAQSLKKTLSKDDFVAQVAIARSRLGTPTSTTVVGAEEREADKTSGTEGRLWAVSFNNAYRKEQLRERLVMVKEADGQFRMAGIWATPLKNALEK